MIAGTHLEGDRELAQTSPPNLLTLRVKRFGKGQKRQLEVKLRWSLTASSLANSVSKVKRLPCISSAQVLKEQCGPSPNMDKDSSYTSPEVRVFQKQPKVCFCIFFNNNKYDKSTFKKIRIVN
jgi:hypothetical protein